MIMISSIFVDISELIDSTPIWFFLNTSIMIVLMMIRISRDQELRSITLRSVEIDEGEKKKSSYTSYIYIYIYFKKITNS